jgi:hypothetical protein
MNMPAASIILSSSNFDLVWVAAGVIYLTAHSWRLFVRWLNRNRARHWPTISATVDVVSVTRQVEQAGRGMTVVHYLATLTYFYRNPDLQTGDYSRRFGQDEESAAQAWATSYKDSSVLVHVDPRDPSRSVLREDELYG